MLRYELWGANVFYSDLCVRLVSFTNEKGKRSRRPKDFVKEKVLLSVGKD